METILHIPAEDERNLFGQFDSYLKKIERTLQVSVVSRDGALHITGSESALALERVHGAECGLRARFRAGAQKAGSGCP